MTTTTSTTKQNVGTFTKAQLPITERRMTEAEVEFRSTFLTVLNSIKNNFGGRKLTQIEIISVFINLKKNEGIVFPKRYEAVVRCFEAYYGWATYKCMMHAGYRAFSYDSGRKIDRTYMLVQPELRQWIIDIEQ